MKETFKHPVKLEVTNLLEGVTYVKDTIYEKETLNSWVQHQVGEMGAQFHTWKIIEIEGDSYEQ